MKERVLNTTVIGSPGAVLLSRDDVFDAVKRHASGDWGWASKLLMGTNMVNWERGTGRIVSRFKRSDGDELWVTTVFEEGITRLELLSEIRAGSRLTSAK